MTNDRRSSVILHFLEVRQKKMAGESGAGPGFFTSKLERALGWARKNSIFQYPFVTACCGMEYMSAMAARYDIARFGAEFPRFSPRQADLLMIVGTINVKQSPVLSAST